MRRLSLTLLGKFLVDSLSKDLYFYIKSIRNRFIRVNTFYYDNCTNYQSIIYSLRSEFGSRLTLPVRESGVGLYTNNDDDDVVITVIVLLQTTLVL